jgi:hypothetical protein
MWRKNRSMRRSLPFAALIAVGVLGFEGVPVALGQSCYPSYTCFAGAQPGVICPGQSVQLSAGVASGPCSWSPMEGVTDPLSCQTTAQPSHTTRYLATFMGAYCHCYVTLEADVVVLPPSAAPTIAAPASAAPGQIGLVASVPIHEGQYFASSYRWTILNGEVTSGQGTFSITFSAARNPIKVEGKQLGVQLSVIEIPVGTCESDAATATVALGPLRNPRTIPFR